ncbi:MAG: TonB-dependent receptor [Saprospiraceae bacterium]|nr:TonB-dependent receptor [Saprospiraceae bacterium]
MNGRAFLKINVYQSRYRYQSINAYQEKISINQQTQPGINELTEFRSSIKETGVKSDVSFLTGFHHQFKSGLNLAIHDYIPGVVAYSDQQDPEPLFSIERDLPQLSDALFDELSFRSRQASVFVEDQWDLTQYWKINMGFNALLFNSDQQCYFALQPRFNIIHEFKSQSLALSINKLSQSQHLITANDNGLPNELWVPASRNIRPQNSWNLDLTWTYLLSDKTTIKSSVFLKKLSGLITFQDNPGYLSYGSLDNVDASIWESDVLTGDGESWGIENSFSHHWTRFSLQLNYTFLKSSRYFAGKNLGYSVPYEFEVPHTVNILGLWQINKNVNLGVTWQLSSGTRYNLIPGDYDLYDKSEYFLDQFTVEDENLDLLIMPIYHRLDLSASYMINRGDKIKHQFKLSLLNLYDRRNIIFPRIYRGDPTDIRFSEGLPFIPSLSYHFSFN